MVIECLSHLPLFPGKGGSSLLEVAIFFSQLPAPNENPDGARYLFGYVSVAPMMSILLHSVFLIVEKLQRCWNHVYS